MDISDLIHRIDVDRIVRRTVELVQLPSVNPFDGEGDDTTGERAVAQWMTDHLERLGYETNVGEIAPGRPNVVGIGPGGGGPVLALVGHTDTVGVGGYDDPFSGTISDGRIHGRGTCDMKGALAAFIEVAEVLHDADQPLRGRLMIAGIADEEHGMLGSRALGIHGALADYAIVGEPTDLDVCIAHKGQYAFPVRTFGTAVHSSIADQGVNAIESMMEVVSAFSDYDRQLRARPVHPLCGTATANVGTIRGGELVSIVPDFCEIHVDRRVLPGESTAQIRREISDLLESLASQRTQVRWELGDPFIDAGPLSTPLEHPIVAATLRAIRRRSPAAQPSSFPGATDAPNLGIPAVIWGPGSLSLAHTTAESIAIDELVRAVHYYLDAVVTLIG